MYLFNYQNGIHVGVENTLKQNSDLHKFVENWYIKHLQEKSNWNILGWFEVTFTQYFMFFLFVCSFFKINLHLFISILFDLSIF